MELMIFLGLVIAAIIVYSIIENRFIRITEYVIRYRNDGTISDAENAESESKPCNTSLSIVQLSDLHDCRYGKDNGALLEKIKCCEPDVILITGDMKNKYKNASESLYRFYKNLSAICPCFYSLGNHELKDKKKNPESFFEYVNKVRECGIIISDNEVHRVQLNGISCFLASYSSTLAQYKRRKQNKECDPESQLKVPQTNQDDRGLRILLSHDPELTRIYQKSEYPLIFSGHLHGGIVRIPGYRGVISTRFVLFPRYDGGCYSLDEQHRLVVSRGLGSHTIKFRLFNRPEVVHAVIHMEA